MAGAIQLFGSVALDATRPPHGFGSGDPTAWKRIHIEAQSKSADILGVGVRSVINEVDTYLAGPGVVPVVFAPTVDCYFRATASIDDADGNAIATDFPMKAGWLYKFVHVGAADRYVSVMRKTEDGYLYYYVPTDFALNIPTGAG
jgi:hypothetical protein